MKTGAPTKFKRGYCSAAIDHMAQGLSFESFGGVLGVSKKTLHNWCSAHPEFDEAKRIGQSKALLHLEKLGLQGLFEEVTPGATRRKFNTAHWQFIMRNLHGWTCEPKEVQAEPQIIQLAYSPRSERKFEGEA